MGSLRSLNCFARNDRGNWLLVNHSEPDKSSGEGFSLRRSAAADVGQTSTAADEGNVRRGDNRKPLGLDFESEMASWVKADSSTKAKGEAREADSRRRGRKMRRTNAAQDVRFGPLGPFFDVRFMAEIAMELIEDHTLLRRSRRNLLRVDVRILPRPAELDEILFTIGKQPKAKGEAEAGTGVEDDPRVRPSDLRLYGKSHAGAISSKRGEVEAERFGF